MFSINNNDEKIYITDTYDTLRLRVYTTVNTLSEYSVPISPFPKTRKEFFDSNIQLFDLISSISSFHGVNFVEYIISHINIFNDIEDALDLNQVIILFINIKKQELLTAGERLVFEVMIEDSAAVTLNSPLSIKLQEIKNDVKLISDFTIRILNDTKNLLDQINARLESNSIQNGNNVRTGEAVENLPQTKISQLYMDKSITEVRFHSPFKSQSGLFNLIKTTQNVPVVVYDDFYKTYYGNKLLIPRNYSKPDVINFIVNIDLHVTSRTADDLSHYHNVEVSLDEWSGIITGKFFHSKKLTVDNVIARVLSTANLQLEEIDRRILNMYGTIFVPNFKLNSYLFTDMVLNNPMVSPFLQINENIKSLKNKITIYTHFMRKTENRMSVNITPRLVQRNDIFLKNTVSSEDMKEYQLGTPFLRIRVKTKLEQTFNFFMDVLGKLLSAYTSISPALGREYIKYIPDFETEYNKYSDIETKEIYLKDYEPDIFLSGYARKCARAPIIIDSKNRIEWEDANYQILEFPINNPQKIPRLYTCNTDKYPYVGVIENKLSNKDIYPFLPCCFEMDQRRKHNFVRYIQNRGVSRQEKGDYIITTNKFVEPGSLGNIPDFIDTILYILYLKYAPVNSNYSFHRTGVTKSPNSFIECVYLALKPAGGRMRNIEDIRLEIANTNNLSVSKQQNYKSSLEEIKSDIDNTESYFDPKKYVCLLENFFNCKIILFTRTSLSPSGDFLLPYYEYNLYRRRYDNSNRLVLIYENYGSELNENPRCEIILLSNPDKITSFDMFTSFATDLMDLEYNRFPFYTLNIIDPPVRDILYEEKQLDIISSQYIDSFGKTRAVKLNIGKESLYILIDPIAPLSIDNLMSITEFAGVINNISLIREGKKMELYDIVSQYTDNDVVQIIHVRLPGDVIGYIQTDSNKEDLPGIPVNDIINAPAIVQNRANSLFDQYLTVEHYNRCLFQFSIFMFSEYLYQSKIDNPTYDDVDNFIDNKCEFSDTTLTKFWIITDHISELKGTFEGGGGSLIASSNDCKGLRQHLKYLIAKNMVMYILSFRRREVIPNFYKYTYDFTQYSQILVKEYKIYKESVLFRKTKTNIIFSNVRPDLDVYFFQNTQVANNAVFLAQISQTIERALDVSRIWSEQGYNLSFFSRELEITEEFLFETFEPEFTFYNYISQTNIDQYIVSGDSNQLGIQILGYHDGDGIKFISLLQL